MLMVVAALLLLIFHGTVGCTQECMQQFTSVLNSLKDELALLRFEMNKVRNTLTESENRNRNLVKRIDDFENENQRIKRTMYSILRKNDKLRAKFTEGKCLEKTVRKRHFDIPVDINQSENRREIRSERLQNNGSRGNDDTMHVTNGTTFPKQQTISPGVLPKETKSTIVFRAPSMRRNVTPTPSLPPPIMKVAFSVGLTKTVDLDFIQTVFYDRIYVNIGGGYDIKTGSFVVPTSGFYVLTYSALNVQGHTSYIELVHDGVRMAITSLDGRGNNMGSQTIIAFIKKGDAIWVRNASSAGPQLLGRASETYNRFSGFLLLNF